MKFKESILCVQVASELNAAILKAQNVEETSPLLSELLKLLLWAQHKLIRSGVNFPVMSDLVTATLTMPSSDVPAIK